MSETRNRETIEWLWQRAAANRDAGGPPEAVRLLEDARAAQVTVGWRELSWLIEKAGPRSGPWTPAEFLVDFLRVYLDGRGAECLVDPAATAPAILLALADGCIAKRAVGFTASLELAAAATAASGNERVSWHQEWRDPPLPEPAAALGSPELIVSLPPWGMKRMKQRYTGEDGRPVIIDDDAGLQVLLTAAGLSEGGEALFLVPDGFVSRRGTAKVRNVMPHLGLHVHACVGVNGAFRATGASFSLISVRKVPAERTWVGQVSAHDDVRRLAESLRARRPGRTPELGRLVEWDEFDSFTHLAATERLERLVAKAGFPMVPLSEVLLDELKAPLRSQDSVVVDATPNTVYLPTFLSATVHADAGAERLKPSGYVALRLDPTKAIAEYVASMLNAELGRALRAQLSGGTTMPNLRLTALRAAALPLPPLAVQEQAVSTRRTIRDLRLTLDELERRLVERPREAPRVRRQLKQIGQTDPLKPWMESLPFPLASIVWRYRADAEPADKVDHLLRLFEASAEFFATVLLSAFDADEELLFAERPRWCDESGHIPLRRASFGNWTKLGAAMAGSARRMFASTDDEAASQAQMRTALAINSRSFRELVTGKALWKLLDGLTEERNIDAHGGIKGRSDREQKLVRLESALTELRGLTQEAVQEVRLVLPGEGAFRKGVNQYRKALQLAGYVDAFPEELLESTVQLEADELYIVDVSDEPVRGALKVAPLVRLQPAPSTETNACYFYSRLEGEQAEYVSHHFEKEARIPVVDEDLLAFLRRLAVSV